MNRLRSDHSRARWRGLAHSALKLAALLAATSVSLVWAWNTIAVAAFAAPALRFSDALALALCAALLAMTMARAA